ncbi:MAG TPA: peptide MFS transporter [Gemmatimonadaceae bacterium]|jgi:POT family proton-dependent oligopeptide transporter
MANQSGSLSDQPEAAAFVADVPPELVAIRTDKSFFGHPRGLSTLFFTEMWERFSFYGIRPMLITFMIVALTDGGAFGFDRGTAGSILGVYAASVYLTSLPGGWIADRWLGLQRAVFWGGVLIALGHLSVALSGMLGKPVFFLGLILIVMGTGLLKPNVSAMVGDLYADKGARRDAGFSVFYMGINLGATLGPLVTGFLRNSAGYHYGFGAAGVGMLIGVIQYRLRAGKTLGPVGTKPNGTPGQARAVKIFCVAFCVAVVAVIGLAAINVLVFNAKVVASMMVYLEVGAALLYFAYLFFFAGLDKDEMKRVAVIGVLFAFAAIFWSGFEQAPSSLNLFAKDFTERHLFGFEVPFEWLQVVNSFFVVAFAPVFAWIWMTLAKRNITPSSPAKFSFGLFCAGLGFLVMVPPVRAVVASGGTLKVSMLWLTFSYILQTFGELSLSPVGLSSMTKLAPPRFSGQMMGVWFLAASLGNLIAGIVGGDVDPEKLDAMTPLFVRTTGSLFIASVIALLLVKPISNMMKTSSAAGGH